MYLSAFQSKLEASFQSAAEVAVCPALSSEYSLIARAQRSDAGALSEIYELYFDRIFRYVAVRLNDRDEAEDITQEVFLKVLKAIGRYRSTGAPFLAWLYRIARNQLIDYLRHKSHRATITLDDALASSTLAPDNPQTAAETEYEMEQLKLAVGLLTPAQREVIMLRFTSDLPLANVAKIVGKSVGAVKTLQHSAIVNLKKKCIGRVKSE
jgi:RNA polymerase sigma-70 factor, ECF subfamily